MEAQHLASQRVVLVRHRENNKTLDGEHKSALELGLAWQSSVENVVDSSGFACAQRRLA